MSGKQKPNKPSPTHVALVMVFTTATEGKVRQAWNTSETQSTNELGLVAVELAARSKSLLLYRVCVCVWVWVTFHL